jgi:N-methylhydantoinase A/oxoprolinase/acetone carboxylase beta subunit
VTAVGRTGSEAHVPARGGTADAAATVVPLGTRLAWHETGMIPHDVHDLVGLPAGVSVTGPAILQAPTTTVLLPPGDRLHRRDAGCFVVDMGAQTS